MINYWMKQEEILDKSQVFVLEDGTHSDTLLPV